MAGQKILKLLDKQIRIQPERPEGLLHAVQGEGSNPSLSIMTMLGSHISEIVARRLYVLLAWALRFVVGYEYSVELVERRSAAALAQLDQGFLLTGPLEILSTLLGLSAWSARFLSAPRLYLQCALFMFPGLYRSEVRGFLCAYGRLCCLWFMSAVLRFARLPLLWGFLFGLLPGNEALDRDLHLRLSEYLGTVRWAFKLINVVIYLPAVLFLFTRFGYLPRDWFLKSRRTTLLMCVVLGACLTPPDVLSQLLVAGVLAGLLELRRLALCFVVRYR